MVAYSLYSGTDGHGSRYENLVAQGSDREIADALGVTVADVRRAGRDDQLLRDRVIDGYLVVAVYIGDDELIA